MKNKKLKIAVFHNLPSGGAKRSLYTYINYLTKNGHIVDVFIPKTANEEYLPLKPIVNNMIKYDVKSSFIKEKFCSICNYFQININKTSVSNLMKTEKKIANDLNNSDYDIIYCEQDQSTMTPVILKYLTKKNVFYCQQPFRREKILKMFDNQKFNLEIFYFSLIKSIANYFINYIEKKQYKRDLDFAEYSTNLLANSFFSHENILRQYGKNAYVSYIGVDTNIFKHLNLERDNFVLSVGVFTPAKGFDFIIKSISHIKKEKRPELIIVGNNSEKGWINYLKKLAKEKKVKLNIMTKIPNEDLIMLYNKAKLVVYAPYLEPLGYVPLEAMACGTPVVGVKEGGIKETVIHNKTGLLTQRDENEFAEAIIKLSEDMTLWNKMSINGIQHIKSFWTLELAGERLISHLYRIINDKDTQS